MLIRGPEKLASLVQELRDLGSFALDTEFIRERTYRPRLCLIQVATLEKAVLVDPFSLPDMTPFLELIFDPSIEKVVHSGDQDMEIFYALGGQPPRNVFDTQVAAALAGHGESISYARLVEETLGIRLSKHETYTDWARRPLSHRQLEYALADVKYLHPARKLLLEDLERRGRMDWLREELAYYEEASHYDRDPALVYRKVKSASRLGPGELAVLREVAAWREEEAARVDWPRGRVLTDELLVELARRAPTDVESIAAVRGIHPQLVRRAGEEIVRRVARALSLPPSEHPPPLERRSDDAVLALVVDLLEIVLRARAEEVQVAPGYLGSRKDLLDLARRELRGEGRAERPLPILTGWRKGLVGDALLDLLHGRSTVAVARGGAKVEVARRDGGPGR
jgi:ribonuclease D